MEAIPKIYSQTDYKMFDFINGNRNISERKVEKLVYDIENGLNLLPYFPIIVHQTDGKFFVIDGQHRFEASKKVGSPIFFVVCDKIELRQIATMNSRTDKWNQRDFLNCYMKVGLEPYVVLNDLLKKYKFTISITCDLMMTNKTSGGGTMDDFRDGKLECNFLEETEKTLALVNVVFDLYKFRKDRNLVTAMKKIMDKGLCDFKVLKRKIESAPMMMDKQESVKDYMHQIEKVYNYRNNERQQIF